MTRRSDATVSASVDKEQPPWKTLLRSDDGSTVCSNARRDDYGTLLSCGDVVRSLADIADAATWRSDLRRRAREDRIRIRSGTGRAVVWALLLDGDTEHRRARKVSATATS